MIKITLTIKDHETGRHIDYISHDMTSIKTIDQINEMTQSDHLISDLVSAAIIRNGLFCGCYISHKADLA